MIANFHGMYGKSKNTNYQLLTTLVSEKEIYSPQMDYHQYYLNDVVYRVITDLKFEDHLDLIVGNSFGGFVAMYIASLVDAPCILVNPCIRPDISLDLVIPGYAKRNEPAISHMMSVIKNCESLVDRCKIILGDNDEILDRNLTYDFFKKNADIQVVHGGHQLSGEDFNERFITTFKGVFSCIG